MTAREALAGLLDGFRLGRGSIRVKVSYADGYVEQVRLNPFRVPPASMRSFRTQIVDAFDEQLLQQIAAELGLDEGRCSLTAEYEAGSDGRLHLHWVDFEYGVEAV